MKCVTRWCKSLRMNMLFNMCNSWLCYCKLLGDRRTVWYSPPSWKLGHVVRTFNDRTKQILLAIQRPKLIHSFHGCRPALGSGRPKSETSMTLRVGICQFARLKESRRLASEVGIRRRSVLRILHGHLYKFEMLRFCAENEPDRRVQFCEQVLNRFENDSKVLL